MTNDTAASDAYTTWAKQHEDELLHGSVSNASIWLAAWTAALEHVSEGSLGNTRHDTCQGCRWWCRTKGLYGSCCANPMTVTTAHDYGCRLWETAHDTEST